MIADTINQEIARALKSGDRTKVSTLRLLSSALNYERIAKGRDLTEEEEILVVKKEVKKRKEAIEIYDKVGESERADLERKELSILEEFLPKQISDEELEKIIDDVILYFRENKLDLNFGMVMKEVMKKVLGKADGKKVSEIVKSKLG